MPTITTDRFAGSPSAGATTRVTGVPRRLRYFRQDYFAAGYFASWWFSGSEEITDRVSGTPSASSTTRLTGTPTGTTSIQRLAPASLALSGDMTDGDDVLLLSGDMTDGDDELLVAQQAVGGTSTDRI